MSSLFLRYASLRSSGISVIFFEELITFSGTPPEWFLIAPEYIINDIVVTYYPGGFEF